MELTYINERGDSLTFKTTSPPRPAILLTEADGLYGYEETNYMSDQGGQDGARYQGSKVLPRRIALTIQIMQDVVDNRNSVLRILRPKTLGTLRLTRGSITRDIRCVAEKVTTNTQDASIMNIYLIGPNPYWREENESQVNIATWTPLFQYPMTIEQGVGFMFGQRTEERVINVRNEGSAPAGMRIAFTARGTVTNPKISNAMDGSKYILANMTMENGDILTIHTGIGEKKATIYRANGGQESNAFTALDVANLTFLQLEPGDNYLSYSADSGETSLLVAVFYYSSYLEV